MTVGIVPQPGDLSMGDLADRLTQKEQDNFTQLTALSADPTAGVLRNLATFILTDKQSGQLAIVARDAASAGTKLFSTTAYILGAQTQVDVYRGILNS